MQETFTKNLYQKLVPESCTKQNAALLGASFWYKFLILVSCTCVTPIIDVTVAVIRSMKHKARLQEMQINVISVVHIIFYMYSVFFAYIKVHFTLSYHILSYIADAL